MAKMSAQIILTLLFCFPFLLFSLAESFTVPSFNSILIRSFEQKRCGANICFGLESSDAAQRSSFNLQKQLINDLVLELTKISHLQLSAVQYGITNTAISPSTYNVTEFLRKLKQASFVRSKTTAIGSPIVYCDAELSEEVGPKIIVLLGRGRNTIGGDPVVRAKLFRESGGQIVAITIGNADRASLIKIVGGNPSRVIDMDNDSKKVVNKVLPFLCPDV